jgi:hypothetical protein
MALLPVCSTLNWKADGKLPLRAVVQLNVSQYVSGMLNCLTKYESDEQSSEGAELIVCQCPTCKMLSWQKQPSRERRVCPFCSSAQPDYVTRIVPESLSTSEAGPGGCDAVSPFVLEFFMVQGSGFRCMAYRNQDGKWRGAFDDEELPGAIRVLG